ncbi:unnamed protein product [Amoebophrya sp. A25]|nr:unnamed protein product [Amoebophrya sp. A25]|eukprot:GSA25T00004897001.1
MARLVYLKESEYKAQKALVAAKFCGIKLESKQYNAATDSMDHNPWKRLPFLETEGGVIANSNAIARYVARMRPDCSLFGSKFSEACQVDSWMEFCTREVEVPAGVLVWSHLKYIDTPAPATLTSAAADLTAALSLMETQLSKTAFLVGREVTLADIALVCSLADVFRYALDETYRKQFPNLMAWYGKCLDLPQFQSVLPAKVEMCKESTFSPPARGASTTGGAKVTAPAQAPKAAAPAQAPKAAPVPKVKSTPAPKATAAPKATPAAAPAAAPAAGAELKGTPEEQAALQAAKDKVRELKAAGADKAAVEAAVADMKRLKEVCGEVDPPKKKKK